MYDDRNCLFYERDLGAQLCERQQRAMKLIDGIPQDQFLISSDEQLVAYIETQLRVEQVVLHEEARSMHQQECQIDLSEDPRRALYYDERRGPIQIPGTRLLIHIPFSGAGWLFRYRTDEFEMTFPYAGVHETRGGRPAEIVITVVQPHDTNPEEFKRAFEREIQLIRRYLTRATTQVEAYNLQLPGYIQTAVQNRRQRLERHKGLSALLDIPLQERPGAPSIQPVRVEVRPLPALPAVPRTGLHPEPGITEETYERILSVIRHEGRTFETTPGTFVKLEEEELRNVILAHLNGHFQGKAAGEVFRGKGKTDICIEEDNRAAFVGECKVWRGAGQVSSDLDQLLGYLTWRDSKAAFIVFNKTVQEFATTVLTGLPKAVSEHRCFLRPLLCPHAGEWRMSMRSIEDAGRLVTVHVFAINIFTETKKANSKAGAA